MPAMLYPCVQAVGYMGCTVLHHVEVCGTLFSMLFYAVMLCVVPGLMMHLQEPEYVCGVILNFAQMLN